MRRRLTILPLAVILMNVVLLYPFAATSQTNEKELDEIPEGAIRDDMIYHFLERGSRKLVDQKETTALSVLADQLQNEFYEVKTTTKSSKKPLTDAQIYEQCKKSVMIVGTVYKCPNCPNDHFRAASGFIISEEGIGVTNYHIFRGHATDERSDIAHVTMDYKGNVYPIKEVLAASFADDLAVFSFDKKDKELVPIALGEDAKVGAEVQVISHPHNMYYSFTKGSVCRLYWREGGEKMSVTADFSQGSSGAPVLNKKGEVIGVVSSTLSLYNSDKNLQMVSKETIPVKAIRKLISPSHKNL